MTRADPLGTQPLVSQPITTGRNAQAYGFLLADGGVMSGELASQPAHLHPHHRIVARAIHRRITTKYRDTDGVLGQGNVQALRVMLHQKTQQAAHPPGPGERRTGQQ
ncbi:hypothetical protein D3C73_1298340 [compost metagenome]